MSTHHLNSSPIIKAHLGYSLQIYSQRATPKQLTNTLDKDGFEIDEVATKGFERDEAAMNAA